MTNVINDQGELLDFCLSAYVTIRLYHFRIRF